MKSKKQALPSKERAEKIGTRELKISMRMFKRVATQKSFVSKINFEGAKSLLDVGCGPGTIALEAAPHLEAVYGLDYSSGMLEFLKVTVKREASKTLLPYTNHGKMAGAIFQSAISSLPHDRWRLKISKKRY